MEVSIGETHPDLEVSIEESQTTQESCTEQVEVVEQTQPDLEVSIEGIQTTQLSWEKNEEKR